MGEGRERGHVLRAAFAPISIKILLGKKERAGSRPSVCCNPVNPFIGEGNSNPLQYSCLGNLVDRGAWWAYAVHGVARIGHDLAIKPPSLPLWA